MPEKTGFEITAIVAMVLAEYHRRGLAALLGRVVLDPLDEAQLYVPAMLEGTELDWQPRGFATVDARPGEVQVTLVAGVEARTCDAAELLAYRDLGSGWFGHRVLRVTVLRKAAT